MDLDLRKLRYFVAVAEELHFGRSADRLHIAQPVLSRQIRALEDELRAQLFVRTKRATELTAAGRQLLEDAHPLLRQRVSAGLGRPAGPSLFSVPLFPGPLSPESLRGASGRRRQSARSRTKSSSMREPTRKCFVPTCRNPCRS